MESQVPTPPVPDHALIRYTHWIYGLHAFSVLWGVITATSVVTLFLFGWPSIIAVIMNYARRSHARGTWLESHFRWQIRTFWFTLLWVVIITVICSPFFLILVGLYLWMLGAAVIGLWVIYRVARGWLALRNGRSVGVHYMPPVAPPAAAP